MVIGGKGAYCIKDKLVKAKVLIAAYATLELTILLVQKQV